MTDQTAATEAVMSNDDLIFQLSSLTCEVMLAEKDQRRYALCEQYRRYCEELKRRLTVAAPPSGQVVVDAEALAWLIDAAEEYAAIQAARTPVIASERQEIESEVECITAAVSMARTAQGNGTTS